MAPRQVLLGPAPCQGCGAWVEWDGLGWVALATDEFHDCAPYLQPWQRELLAKAIAPDGTARRLVLNTGRSRRLPVYGRLGVIHQALGGTAAEPRWVRWLDWALWAALAVTLILVLVAAAVAR